MRYSTAVLVLCLSSASLSAQQPTGIVSSGQQSYTLRPGDIVDILVWGQPDFSGQFQVDETGRIRYPVLGEVDTRDRTVADVREAIRTGLEEIFNNPFVTITPRFRIAVIGEVRAPGLLTVDPTLSVLDVVALAGGYTTNGKIDDIRLFRGGQELNLGLRTEEMGGVTLQAVGIRSGDQIVVPRKARTLEYLTLILLVSQIALSIAILANTVN